MKFIKIKIFDSRIEAEIAKSLLLSSGVKAQIQADKMGGMRPALALSGGVSLLISEKNVNAALQILVKIITILIASSILGCTSNQVQSKSPTPIIKSSALEANDQILKIMNVSQLQIELDSIDGQIASLDGLIANTQARIQSYQVMNVPGNEGMIAGAQGELMSYDMQKSSLLARKTQIQSSLRQNQ